MVEQDYYCMTNQVLCTVYYTAWLGHCFVLKSRFHINIGQPGTPDGSSHHTTVQHISGCHQRFMWNLIPYSHMLSQALTLSDMYIVREAGCYVNHWMTTVVSVGAAISVCHTQVNKLHIAWICCVITTKVIRQLCGYNTGDRWSVCRTSDKLGFLVRRQHPPVWRSLGMAPVSCGTQAVTQLSTTTTTKAHRGMSSLHQLWRSAAAKGISVTKIQRLWKKKKRKKENKKIISKSFNFIHYSSHYL